MSKRLTIEEIDKKISNIENYYWKGHKATSTERIDWWSLSDRMQLGRLYKLKEKTA